MVGLGKRPGRETVLVCKAVSVLQKASPNGVSGQQVDNNQRMKKNLNCCKLTSKRGMYHS